MQYSTVSTVNQFCICTCKGNITYISPSFYSTFDYAAEEILSSDINSFFKLLKIDADEKTIKSNEEYVLFSVDKCFLSTIFIEEEEGNKRSYYFRDVRDILSFPEISCICQLYQSSDTVMAVATLKEHKVIGHNDAWIKFADEKSTIGKELYNYLSDDFLMDKHQDIEPCSKNNIIFRNCRYEKKSSRDITSYWDVTLKKISTHNNMSYIVVTADNITENIKNEDMIYVQKSIISKQQHQIEVIVENMSDCLFIADTENRYTTVNRTARETFGIGSEVKTVGDVIKKVPIYKLDGTTLKYEEIPIVKALKGDNVTSVRVFTKDEEIYRYYDINATPIYNNKEVSRAVMSFRDVSNIIVENERLTKQRDSLYAILNSLELPLARVSSKDFEVIEINNEGRKLMEGLGFKVKSFFLEELAVKEQFSGIHEFLQESEKLTCTRYVKNVRFEINGIESYYNVIWQPFLELNEIVIVAVDVTEELLQKKKTDKLLKAQEEFFSFISHEFKTPITVALSALQVLELSEKEALGIFTKKYLDKIRQSCLQQLRLVNNLLDITRADSGYLKLNRRNMDIVEITKEIVDSIEFYSKEKGIEVIFSSESQSLYTALDDEKYERIILNLLSNAVKFTPRGNNIYVNIHTDEKTVEITVRDEGVGIPKEKLEYIFERYSQVRHGSIRNIEGTGIGLFLAKLMTKALGGSIRVNSELGLGTTFVVSLPLELIVDEANFISEDFMDNRLIRSISIEFSDLETS